MAELVKRNFSMVLHQEGGYIYDSEVLVSVTQVYITPDSSIAKIYVSVYNTESKQAVVDLIRDHMVRLKQLFTQRIRRQVRRIPHLDIYLDETLDEIDRVNNLFDKIESEDKMRIRKEKW
ncbi:MAG: ribosome-binding factor A [Bacteroidota bacterium]